MSNAGVAMDAGTEPSRKNEAPRAAGRRRSTFHLKDQIATLILCGVLALAPLPFGSVQTGPIAVWTGLLAITLLAGHGGETSRKDGLVASVFAVVASIWLAIVLVQLLPIWPRTAQFAYPIWAETQKLTGIDGPAFVSATRNQPLFAAGAEISIALAFLCGYFVGRRRLSARLMLKAFAISGLVYAIYGILGFVFAPDYVLWLPKPGYRNVLTSTFINANTAAVYFGACSVAWLLLLLEGLHGRSSANRDWRDVKRLASSRNTALRALAFTVILAAAFMTGSRLGTAVTLFAVGGAAATFYRRSLDTWRTALIGLLAVSGVALLLQQLLGGRVNQRYDVGGLSDEARLQTWQSTLNMIQDYPWLGTGLGTFRWAFPEYRSGSISVSGIWDRAHSTPLELAAEMGIPFATLVAACWLLTILLLVSGMLGRKRDDILPAAAFWASMIGLLHSLMDFSLQIPGFAIVILTLAGMGLAQSTSSRNRARASGLLLRDALN